MKAPIEEIFSKSTICNFLLMINCNRGCINLRLQDRYFRWQSPVSSAVFWL